MGFNSAFKGLKLLKTPGNGRLNNLNNLKDPVLNVLREAFVLCVLPNKHVLQRLGKFCVLHLSDQEIYIYGYFCL